MKYEKLFYFLAFSILFSVVSPAYAGTLSCSITTAAACTGTVIYRMSGATNAHAELPSQSTAAYASNVVCCTGVTGLGTSCAGIFATALKLSGVTNAHVQQNTQTPYANNACVSVTAGGTVSVGYQATNCIGFDTTLGSMSAVTNAHVGNSAAYSAIQICGTATAGAAQSLTFSLGANSLALGTLSTAAAVTGSHAMNVSTNAANGMSVTVSGSTLTFGANTITACSAGCTSLAGTKQFGINLVANTSPAVGANPSGTAPIGSAATGYGTANSFRFVSGETVANSTGAINDTTYTISYLVNISPVTAAGTYTTALTYVATGNF